MMGNRNEKVTCIAEQAQKPTFPGSYLRLNTIAFGGPIDPDNPERFTEPKQNWRTDHLYRIGLASGATRGEVEFYLDGDHIVGCEDQPVMVGNTATCTVTNLALASHELSAEYGGHATYLASTSSVLTQVVDFWKSFLPRVGR